MKNQITARQASIMIFTTMIAGKLMILPSIISFNSSQDTWLVFLFMMMLDFVMALVLIAVTNKIDVDIFTFLQNKIGRVLTTIIACFVGALFVLKILDINFQLYIILNEKIYAEYEKLKYLVLIFIIIVYFGTRQLRSLGRTMEILFTTLCGTLVLSFLISMTGVEITSIFPIFKTGISRMATNSFEHLFWFGDSLMFLFFAGHIKKEKNTTKTLALSYLASILVVTIFVVLFVSIFQNISSMYRACLLDIGEILPRLVSEARFNWIVYCLYPIAPIFAIGIYSQIANTCFCYMAKPLSKKPMLISTIFTVILVFGGLLIFKSTWQNFYLFVVSYMPYVCVGVQFVLPIVLLILAFCSNQKIENSKLRPKHAKNNIKAKTVIRSEK